MPLYFLIHDADRFAGLVRPALAASWAQRSFEPCRPLRDALLPEVRSFLERFHLGQDEPLLAQLEQLRFSRAAWRLLVGEVLLYGAAEIPEVPTVPDTLTRLLAPAHVNAVSRAEFAPIQQAHFGALDLTFGGAVYRPEQTGYNGAADVARLADYLDAVEPDSWTTAALAGLPGLTTEDEREEELDLAREWFGPFRDLYHRTSGQPRLIVCDQL